MQDEMKFNAEGNENTDELASTGADVGMARTAEWSAGEMEGEREQAKHSTKYAVHVS